MVLWVHDWAAAGGRDWVAGRGWCCGRRWLTKNICEEKKVNEEEGAMELEEGQSGISGFRFLDIWV